MEASLRICHLVMSELLRAGRGWEEELPFWSDRAGHSTKWGTQNCFTSKDPLNHQPWSYQCTFWAERKLRARKEQGLSQASTSLSSFQSAKRGLTNPKWTVHPAVDVEGNILAKRALCCASRGSLAFWVPAYPLCLNLSLSRLKTILLMLENNLRGWKLTCLLFRLLYTIMQWLVSMVPVFCTALWFVLAN